ncbi:uncharacterized protein LOC109723037 isoform X2 [Ananas comosus]|uniref:Uncharacterized protein LOC109723037 isoform X2 n=1 Tax=Ananas comosus TaxID=4615 RepID=A0A6P5GG64_ANACO|nr:uncharacterized protein LOC109723037 isoform X2 [Ananas comosus]
MEDRTVAAPSSGPSSPGVYPVALSDAMDELLRFTLSLSFSSSSPDADEDEDDDASIPGLSVDYCSRLLQDDPITVHPHLNDAEIVYGGVPQYPLYKHLARAIERCIYSGSFLRPVKSEVAFPVEPSKMKEDKWDKLILDKGAKLLNMFNSVDFELHVQEPYFSQLRAGLKRVEGRCAVGNYNRIAEGSLLLFNKCLLLEVERVTHYNSFYEMLQAETLTKVLPGVVTVEEGVQIYRKFYTEEKERSSGVLAISVTKPASQPYIYMKELLSRLGYDGVSSLLGMAHTVGTVPDGLPPPRSILIASSMRSHRPDVKGCSLTDAARALAKHVNRSSNGWWGDFRGTEANKNQLASEVVNRLLADCCWMNVHLIHSNDCVFEIRVREGYGARWSKDGSKVCNQLNSRTILFFLALICQTKLTDVVRSNSSCASKFNGVNLVVKKKKEKKKLKL